MFDENNSKYYSFSWKEPQFKEDENIQNEMTVHKKCNEAIFTNYI